MPLSSSGQNRRRIYSLVLPCELHAAAVLKLFMRLIAAVLKLYRRLMEAVLKLYKTHGGRTTHTAGDKGQK